MSRMTSLFSRRKARIIIDFFLIRVETQRSQNRTAGRRVPNARCDYMGALFKTSRKKREKKFARSKTNESCGRSGGWKEKISVTNYVRFREPVHESENTCESRGPTRFFRSRVRSSWPDRVNAPLVYWTCRLRRTNQLVFKCILVYRFVRRCLFHMVLHKNEIWLYWACTAISKRSHVRNPNRYRSYIQVPEHPCPPRQHSPGLHLRIVQVQKHHGASMWRTSVASYDYAIMEQRSFKCNCV